MDFLTTSEAADYVRLGERKLYELVTSGAIPCSKVTGKWLFPRQELDLWIMSGLARPAGMTAADPPPIVGGRHAGVHIQHPSFICIILLLFQQLTTGSLIADQGSQWPSEV
jgi:excisionase family DNA binding protein